MTTPNTSSAKTPTSHTLHVLMVEDMAADYELVRHELGKSGLCLSFRRVETEAELADELRRDPPPDLVLSDHACAAFNSFRALEQVRTAFPDLPFILVTGALGNGLMVRALNLGVDDWVSKNRLPDLLPAVLRALRRAEEQRRLRTAETDRDRLELELGALRGRQALGVIVSVCSVCKKIRNRRDEWIPFEQYFDDRYGIRFTHSLCPECVLTPVAAGDP